MGGFRGTVLRRTDVTFSFPEVVWAFVGWWFSGFFPVPMDYPLSHGPKWLVGSSVAAETLVWCVHEDSV